MIQATAPGMPRGSSWAWLVIVGLAIGPSIALGQGQPAPKADTKGKPPAVQEPEPPPPAEDPKGEVFVDPNAKRTLGIIAPLIYSDRIKVIIGRGTDDRARVQQMITRSQNLDPEFLKRFVNHFAAELTRRDYLNALLNPGPNPKPGDPLARGLEQAVDSLVNPILSAKANNNNEFLAVYGKILFESDLPKVLENNYLSRIQASIVLGTAGAYYPNSIDLFTRQIRNPDQVVWVKLWACRGIVNATQSGRIDLESGKTNQAVDAIVTMLDDPKLFWPAQMRALEALGSLRQATVNMSNKGRVDAASTAMRILTDPEVTYDARAMAAWALGMFRVSPQLNPSYNYALLGDAIGELAVDLGEEIVGEFDANPANFEKQNDHAARLAGLLMFQLVPALAGEDGVRESGLMNATHPNANALKQPYLAKLNDKVKAISLQSYELLRAGGNNIKLRRNDLDARVADMKAFLAQTPPKDRHLVPNGPEFLVNAPDK